MTPEGKVKQKVKAIMKHHGVYWLCPVMNGMGSPALDFHCCHHGVAFFVETKAPGKVATPRQVLTMKQINAAGGTCFVIDGNPGYIELEDWLITTGLRASALEVDDEYIKGT